MRQYSVELRQSIRSARPGDIVLVCLQMMEDSSTVVRFARFCRHLEPGFVGVYLQPTEKELMRVPISLVAALPDNMVKTITLAFEKLSSRTESWQSLLSTIVADEETIRCPNLLKAHVYTKVFSLLQEACSSYGINLSELDARKTTLADLPAVRQVVRLWTENCYSLAWIKVLTEYVRERAEALAAEATPQTFFLPDRKTLITELTSICEGTGIEGFLVEARTTIKSTWDQRLIALNLEMESYLCGARKKQLMNQWLESTKTKVLEYLVEQGYSENATSYDYINAPPLDYAAVQRNLRILQSVMQDINRASSAEPSSSAHDAKIWKVMNEVSCVGVGCWNQKKKKQQT